MLDYSIARSLRHVERHDLVVVRTSGDLPPSRLEYEFGIQVGRGWREVVRGTRTWSECLVSHVICHSVRVPRVRAQAADDSSLHGRSESDRL